MIVKIIIALKLKIIKYAFFIDLIQSIPDCE